MEVIVDITTSDRNGLAVRFTEEGEIVVCYPGGIEDRTGIFPSPKERLAVEAFADTTSGLSLLMRQWRREIHDPLTQLLRRDPGREMIAEQLGRISSIPFNGTVSVLFIDLDHFGKINKQYTHAVGDAVLKCAAKILQRRTRSSDVLIRWGGEEFVIFTMAGMPPEHRQTGRDRDAGQEVSRTGVTESNLGSVLNNGKMVASRILHTMEAAPCVIGDVSIDIRATIGVATQLISSDQQIDTDGLFDVMLKIADTLVITAKAKNARGQVHFARMRASTPRASDDIT